MAQPVGLVVEPVVLNRLGIFPESATTVLADWQQRLEQLLEDQPVGEQWLTAIPGPPPGGGAGLHQLDQRGDDLLLSCGTFKGFA